MLRQLAELFARLDVSTDRAVCLRFVEPSVPDLQPYLFRESFVMNETARTSVYVAAAIVSLIVALFAGPSVPKAPKEFSQVGTEFYPDFTDAKAAKSLQVVSYNSDTAAVRVFGVEQGSDGVWRIPSRHGYPVDGKERLAKTATSVIGIKRDALAGKRKNEHADFGVLDPLGENVSDFKGVGNRLTLKDGKEGKTLVDLIVGKEVKGRPGYFYVRSPKEDPTYIAKVSVDVSTKFADWIEPDLLKLDGTKLRTVIIDKHSIELTPTGGKLTDKETNKLTRANSTDKWQLEGLDESKEEVNEDEVRKLVQALDDLKIVGVRPKGERLKKRLQDDKGLVPDDRTRIEMQDMGFFFIPTRERRGLAMISQEGDVFASTDQGVVYDLHFGSVFSGSEEEVEAGFIKNSEADGEKKEAVDDKKSDSKKVKSRYLFVQTQFDPELLGPKPESPEKPADEIKPEAANPDAPAAADAAENATDKADPKKLHEAAMATYEAEMRKYDADTKSYDDKVKAGEKLVKDLNRRFADWYYVISGDSFENLRQGRKTLVKAKAAEKPTDKELKKEE